MKACDWEVRSFMAIRQLIRDVVVISFVIGVTVGASQQEPPATLKIGASDQITVTVLNQPSYSGRYTVDPAGMIEYAPLSLQLKAAGLSPAELAAAIKAELAAKVFRDPQVTVELDQTAQWKVSVMGEVRFFYFPEHELRFDVANDLGLLDALLVDLRPVRFEPVFVNAQAGVTFKFWSTPRHYPEPGCNGIGAVA